MQCDCDESPVIILPEVHEDVIEEITMLNRVSRLAWTKKSRPGRLAATAGLGGEGLLEPDDA